jgi:hypothetical protein
MSQVKARIETVRVQSMEEAEKPRGERFVLYRRVREQPDVTEHLGAHTTAGKQAVVFFTSAQRAREYASARPGEKWEVYSLALNVFQDWLAGALRAGVALAFIDPRDDVPAEPVHVFRVLLDVV